MLGVMSLPPFVRRKSDELYTLYIWVQPGAKKNELVGTYQNCLKVKLKAPPVDNKANKELKKFLAEKFDLKSSDILLEGGQNSKKKLISIKIKKNFLENKLSMINGGDSNGAI